MFQGSIVRNEPPTPNDPFAGKTLLMHVRDCSDARIAIPFHVGEDRSRTWVLTKTSTNIRLEHDHRHEDGTPDAVTMYGGDTLHTGTSTRQTFPVSARSKALFEREGLKASVTNVWAMEVGRRFAYELRREGRMFRVEFDLETAR